MKEANKSTTKFAKIKCRKFIEKIHHGHVWDSFKELYDNSIPVH